MILIVPKAKIPDVDNKAKCEASDQIIQTIILKGQSHEKVCEIMT
jgi:hypothetical protein